MGRGISNTRASKMTLQLHQKKRSKESLSDEWETPDSLVDYLCTKYNFSFDIDICADGNNKKCYKFISKTTNALNIQWKFKGVWCNPPHTQTKEFVNKAHNQWFYFNTPIMMIIPANSMCTKYAERFIEGVAEYHPIPIRPTFLVDGKPSKFNARNGYFVVIWRKRK